MDPLSLAEEISDSDDFFSLTEKNLGVVQSLEECTGEHPSRFYGKSSLLAFTSRAFDEKAEAPPTNRTQMHRQQFWVTPDVIISIL